MNDSMTRRERLLAVLSGQPTDRVPVMSGHFNEWRDDWKAAEPSYRRLIRFCRDRCDGILSWSARPLNETAPGTSSPQAQVERQTITRPDGALETLTTIQTPRGTLTQRQLRQPGAGTVWTTEHLLKSPEDFERLLSVPYEPISYDVSGFEEADRTIGQAGLVLCETPDPLCMLADRSGMETYSVLAMTEPELFTRLLDRFHVTLKAHLRACFAAGPVRFVRIFGPEYAVPPYLPGHLFDRYVVEYDRELIEMAHRAGAYVRVHSHGRVRAILPKLVAMGADATDPVEPPPLGDITLAEAKALVGDRLTICGNLELRDLETMSREQVADLTRRTLDEGMPGGRFALMPGAEPITIPLNSKLEENWMTYIDTALEHGAYG